VNLLVYTVFFFSLFSSPLFGPGMDVGVYFSLHISFRTTVIRVRGPDIISGLRI